VSRHVANYYYFEVSYSFLSDGPIDYFVLKFSSGPNTGAYYRNWRPRESECGLVFLGLHAYLSCCDDAECRFLVFQDRIAEQGRLNKIDVPLSDLRRLEKQVRAVVAQRSATSCGCRPVCNHSPGLFSFLVMYVVDPHSFSLTTLTVLLLVFSASPEGRSSFPFRILNIQK
jgi:hypothetical protein